MSCACGEHFWHCWHVDTWHWISMFPHTQFVHCTCLEHVWHCLHVGTWHWIPMFPQTTFMHCACECHILKEHRWLHFALLFNWHNYLVDHNTTISHVSQLHDIVRVLRWSSFAYWWRAWHFVDKFIIHAYMFHAVGDHCILTIACAINAHKGRVLKWKTNNHKLVVIA